MPKLSCPRSLLRPLSDAAPLHGPPLLHDPDGGHHPDAVAHGRPPQRGRGGEGLRPRHPVCHLPPVWLHPQPHHLWQRHRLHLPALEADLRGLAGRPLSHLRHCRLSLQVCRHLRRHQVHRLSHLPPRLVAHQVFMC